MDQAIIPVGNDIKFRGAVIPNTNRDYPYFFEKRLSWRRGLSRHHPLSRRRRYNCWNPVVADVNQNALDFKYLADAARREHMLRFSRSDAPTAIEKHDMIGIAHRHVEIVQNDDEAASGPAIEVTDQFKRFCRRIRSRLDRMVWFQSVRLPVPRIGQTDIVRG